MINVDTTKLETLTSDQANELIAKTQQVTDTLNLLFEQMKKGLIPASSYLELRKELLGTLQSNFKQYLS